MRRPIACAIAVVVCADIAGAQPTAPTAAPPASAAVAGQPDPGEVARPSARRRALAVGAAVVPGLALHGSGAFVLGDRPAARRIALAQAIGMTALLAGVLPLGLTYGSPKVVDVAIPLIVGGGSVFLASWVADLYVAAGLSRYAGRPGLPRGLELEVGTTFVRDPQFAYRALFGAEGSWRSGRLRLSAGGQLALGADHQRGGVAVGWRLWPSRPRDRTGIELVGGASVRRYGDDRFTTAVLEWLAVGRVDLHRVARGLDGSFAEIALGAGLELARYRDGATDVGRLPLGRVASGVYLGDGRGEIEVHYEHRRDGLAGGLSLAGSTPVSLLNGFLGSVGVGGKVRVGDGLTVRAGIDVGAAWVGSLAIGWEGR